MRTPEQVAADEALEAAIERVAAAYGTYDPDMILTGFVVVVEAVAVDGDGAVVSERRGILLPNGQFPASTAAGMLSIAAARMIEQYAREPEHGL